MFGARAVAAVAVMAAVLAMARSSGKADPMKEPLELAAKAKAAMAKVKDYSCRLIKRERLEGELSPNHVIDLSVRHEPYSVAMVWQEPKALVGQQVVYVAGKNDGKMRVKPGGLLGSVGFMSLATDDARARKASKHAVTETGMLKLIEKCEEGWAKEQKWQLTTVKVDSYTYAKRRCTRVELTHADKANGKFKHHKNVVYFDQQTELPIRAECYDWPDEKGQAPPLVESFSYVNLKLDVGFEDAAFDR